MKRKITRVLPPDIKQGIRKLFSLVPIRYRLGTRFWQIKNFIENAEKWDSETIKKWQTQKLKETVTNVYAHVPGYYLLYKDAGVKPEDIQSLDDIKILPFVTKELIRDNLKDFTSQAISRLRRLYVTTGGSTGIPFGFYHTEFDNVVERAFMYSGWQRAQWNMGDKSAVLRGSFVGNENNIFSYDPYGMNFTFQVII